MTEEYDYGIAAGVGPPADCSVAATISRPPPSAPESPPPAASPSSNQVAKNVRSFMA